MRTGLAPNGATKRCFKCNEMKPASEFYGHPQMGDGKLGKCKECTKREARARHHAKMADPAWVEQQRMRGREKHKRLYSAGRNWKSPLGSPEQKKAAVIAVTAAVNGGRLVRPTECQVCGATSNRIHGHHDDYSKPLDVVWVCPLCHRRIHAIHPERVKGFQPVQEFTVPADMTEWVVERLQGVVADAQRMDRELPADHWTRATKGTLTISVERGEGGRDSIIRLSHGPMKGAA